MNESRMINYVPILIVYKYTYIWSGSLLQVQGPFSVIED